MKNLRKIRKAVGVTQHQLAASSGVARWRICHAEVGIRPLTSAEEKKIRKVLVTRRAKSSHVLQELETVSARDPEGLTAA